MRDSATARILRAAVALAAITAVVVLVLAVIADMTRDRIEHNERAWFMAQLNQLVPPSMHDNDLLSDQIRVVAEDRLGTPHAVPIYRARRDDKPVAAILRPVAPDGYGGAIELMVAVRYDGTLIGVVVLSHRETPGLGDVFAQEGSQWLASFRGRSLGDPVASEWAVRKDGGQFDQFTGATITPRAIVKAVRRSLEYFARNRATIFTEPAATVE